MTAAITNRMRKICLGFPEAAEKEAWGNPTFRVKDKIFAMEKRGDGRVSVWFKAPPGSQGVPYVGHKGWFGMRLDTKPDWKEVETLIRRSYRMTAPKTLAGMVETA